MSEHTIQLEPSRPADSVPVRLRVTKGPHAGVSWTFAEATTVTIGRQTPAQLKLPDEKALSREHLQLEIRPPLAHLSDKGSSNGTWVNGIRMLAATLSDGDNFGVGDTEITFELLTANRVSGDPSKSQKHEIESEATERISAEPVGNKVDVPAASGNDRGSILRTRVAEKPIDGMSDKFKADQAVKKSIELTQTTANTPRPNDELFSGQQVKTPVDHKGSTVGTDSFPETIGLYTLLDLLGRGGMATVHYAQHRRTKEHYAVKLIRSDVPISEKHLQLFVREATLLTRLEHPRIVKAYEFGIEGGIPFLVMEYIKEVNLLQLLDKQTTERRVKIATWIISRVLQALHYSHAQGIVHRDIKPGNILAYREGRHLQIKLSDFGLAKCYHDAGLSEMTNERSMRGTLAYMAPEQFKNSRDSGPAVDLFACGGCLFRMLTGSLPNVVLKPDDTFRIMKEATHLPARLRQVVMKSIEVEPESRYRSAHEFAKALFPFHERA